MKKSFFYGALFLMGLLPHVLCGCAATSDVTAEPSVQADKEVVYQVATLSSLMQGIYDGDVTLENLTQKGDFGIGTFHGLDGEMVVLDGQVYQVRADGKAVKAEGITTTPFAAVTVFESDQQVALANIESYAKLQGELDKLRATPNMFYGIKVEGTFKYVKTRSVPKQEKPYRKLVEITKEQPVFEFHDVKGTLVGFWCPSFVEGVNMPGYHLHFLTEDLQAGGHLLESSLIEGTVSLDVTNGFQMELPQNEDFAQVDLNEDKKEEIEKVEK